MEVELLAEQPRFEEVVQAQVHSYDDHEDHGSQTSTAFDERE